MIDETLASVPAVARTALSASCRLSRRILANVFCRSVLKLAVYRNEGSRIDFMWPHTGSSSPIENSPTGYRETFCSEQYKTPRQFAVDTTLCETESLIRRLADLLGSDRLEQSPVFLAKDCIGLGVDLGFVGCRQVTGLVLLRGPRFSVRGMRLVLDRILATGSANADLGSAFLLRVVNFDISPPFAVPDAP